MIPGVIATHPKATALYLALMFALALAVTVMLVRHGVVHTGALGHAKPSVYYDG